MIYGKDILIEGNPKLNSISKKVGIPLSMEDKKLGLDLMESIINSQDEKLSKLYNLRASVGIAAPQVGKLKRIFAVHFNDLDGTLYSYICINPVIVNKSKEIIYLPEGEGCLSVKKDTKGLLTPRHKKIIISFTSMDGNCNVRPEILVLEGYPAIVFQHEYDHLDGILYTSKLYKNIKNASPAYKIN